MSDPLADVVTLLRPSMAYSKVVKAAGAWRVAPVADGRVFYCMILAGMVRLTVGGGAPITLGAGDFVLVPSIGSLTAASVNPEPAANVVTEPVMQTDGTVRLGAPQGAAEVEQLVGYCVFGAPDAGLLVSLLPALVIVRGADRLAVIAGQISDEARAARPGRDIVLDHLLSVLFIEALRNAGGTPASPGLLRGLGDVRIGLSLRRMHADPGLQWSVESLARAASLSRSAYFARFRRAVGVPPLEYLMLWRLTLAKELLRNGRHGIAEIAERVGYGSPSAFSAAFSREVGTPPARFARDAERAASAVGPLL